jgi:hypothetical protein
LVEQVAGSVKSFGQRISLWVTRQLAAECVDDRFQLLCSSDSGKARLTFGACRMLACRLCRSEGRKLLRV